MSKVGMKQAICDDDLTVINEWRQKGIFCDAIILANGEEFKAHKIILCACSPYFCSLFTNGWSCENQKVFNIPGVSSEVMKLLIDYAYTQIIPITKETVGEILHAADQFMVTGVVQACCDFLETQLCPQNSISIWRITNTYYLPELRQSAYRFILRNFEEVGRTSEEFLGLSLAELHDFIQEDCLIIKQEDVVLALILRWIEHSPTERKSTIAELLPEIRIGLIHLEFIANDLEDSNECKALILEYIVERWRVNGSLSPPHELTAPQRPPRLPHSILLAIGGWSGNSPTNAIESYDFQANDWVDVAHNENPRAYHGTAFLNGYIFCIGGRDNFQYFNSVRKFNIVTLSWHDVAPMHHRRCFVSVTMLDNCIYAMGGFDGTSRLKSCERYLPETNQWSFISPMQQERSDASAATLQGKVYICGGFNGQHCLFTAEYYSPQIDQWTEITRMHSCRSGVGVSVYREEIFVVGGFDGENRLRTVEAFNPQTNTWRIIPSMSCARSNFGIEVMDDRLFVAGGFDGFATTFLAEFYNESTMTWSIIQSMSLPRSALSCCVVSRQDNINHYLPPRGSL